ncbi:unnamed protein product [Choristocarpus tenellus]
MVTHDAAGSFTVHQLVQSFFSSPHPSPISLLQLATMGKYRVFYLNTNSRALPPREASELYEIIAANIRKASDVTGVDVALVSRGDSTLRGHFPHDLHALEKGLDTRHDGWIIAPFFLAGGRLTAGDIHYVVEQGEEGILIPSGETEFARDPAFGYQSSNLGLWIQEKSGMLVGPTTKVGAAVATGAFTGREANMEQVIGGSVEGAAASFQGESAGVSITSVSLEDLRQGGPDAVRARLRGARGGCVIVNAVEERDLQVFVAGLLLEELEGARFLYRTAADFVAVRGAVDPRPLLTTSDFGIAKRGTTVTVGRSEERMGGLVVVG